MPSKTRKLVALGIGVAFLFAGSPKASAEVLLLSCNGIGSQTAADMSFGSAYSSDGTSFTGSSTSYRTQESADQTVVELQDGNGRIRVPSTILPPIHGGGDHGWWPLSDIVIGESEITARFSLNIFNKPKVVIDRRSGQIQINGLGQDDFRGTCDRLDPSINSRRF
jgi:hypothetical protein